MKDIFKIGDKVFCYNHGGWGEVIKIFNDDNPFPVYCSFELGNCNFTKNGNFYSDGPPILSFTEYTLEGFSQERPEKLPNRGDIVWVRTYPESRWLIGHFVEKDDDRYFISCNYKDKQAYGFEITTTNPYANEHN